MREVVEVEVEALCPGSHLGLCSSPHAGLETDATGTRAPRTSTMSMSVISAGGASWCGGGASSPWPALTSSFALHNKLGTGSLARDQCTHR